jgi:hypothetical protein
VVLHIRLLKGISRSESHAILAFFEIKNADMDSDVHYGKLHCRILNLAQGLQSTSF